MEQQRCPFCHLEQARLVLANDSTVAVPDAFSVAAGHTLVVPKRHVPSLFDLPEAEQAAIWSLVAQVRGRLLDELNPDGFNVGVNDGPAAGQTIMHAHVHVIPRRTGDVADPRGGVRWVIPNKAIYWAGGQQ
jgi:diadenosine tetraphosphate (Ap4A) HIT family hydrolase